MNYAKAIKLVRGRRGLLQRELAAAIDADTSYVSFLEAGKRIPSVQVLERIATALSVPLYLLVFLGSEDGDLNGLSKQEAKQLGQSMLKVLED